MFVRQPIASGNDSGFDSGDSELTSYNYNISNISSYYVPSRTPLSLGSPPSSPPNHNPLLSSLYNPNAYRFQLNRSTGPDQEQFSSNSGSLSRTRKSEEKLRRTLGIDETEIPTISPTITVPSPHLSKTLTSSNSSTEYYTDSMEHPKTRKMSEGLTFLEKLKTVAAEKCEHSKRRQQHKQGKKSLEVVTKRSLILLPETVDLEHTDTLIHAEPDRMVWPMDIQPPVSGVQKLMDLY
ncbi:hypothetical protein HK098_001832 [Nowakowskiella sp. JEL0407]|nr:hypothetical protein HK098_001832 [Nowakowskiella sp. JEL0407]